MMRKADASFRPLPIIDTAAPTAMPVTVHSLYSYPVKSCAGIAHTEALVSPAGLPFDRNWVIVDARGIFMTQRTCAPMALIQPALDEEFLHLSAPDMPGIRVPLRRDGAAREAVPVRIWKSDTLGADEGDAVAQWLARHLGQPCRLLRVHPQARRVANPEYVGPWIDKHQDWAPDFPADHQFAFADGYPFLFIGQASLDELNRRLAERGAAAVPMNRFRPSIVIEGLEPNEEDYLAGLSIGPRRFAFVKRCARCPIPNIDQNTAVSADEPGLTLVRYRSFDDGVLFGVNAVMDGAPATIRVGDAVEPEFDL